MQYLETIRFRTSQTEEHKLGLDFVKQMTKKIDNNDLIETRIYGNSSFPYDFYLLLAWASEVSLDGSAFALGMTNELQRYGLVDHCVWVEYGTEF
jgi:hypothetical protein